MKPNSKIVMLAGAAVLLSTFAAEAQVSKCGKRDSLIKVLIEKYHETPRALGLSSASKVAMEIYASKKGTWTVMMTTTNGTTPAARGCFRVSTVQFSTRSGEAQRSSSLGSA